MVGRGIVFDAVEIVSMTSEQLHPLERGLRSFQFWPRRNLTDRAVSSDGVWGSVGYR